MVKDISGWYIFTTGNIYESFEATKIRWNISNITLAPYIYTISSEPIPENVDLTASSWFKYTTSSNVSLPPNKSFWVKLPPTQVSDDWNIRKDDSIIDSILYDNALWSASLSSDGTILTSHLTATDASINHLIIEDISASSNILTSNGIIKSTNGNILATNGNILATNGNIVATNGNIVATNGIIRTTVGDIYSTTGNIRTTDGDIKTTNGDIIATNGNITIGDARMYTILEAKNNNNPTTTQAWVFKIVYPCLKDDGTQFTPILYKVVVFAKDEMYTYVTNKSDGSHPNNWNGSTNNHGEGVLNLKQNFDASISSNTYTWLETYSDDRLKHQEVPIDNGLFLINQLKTEFYKKTKEMKESNYMGDISGEWWWERGVIAQDLLKTDFSYCVHTPSFPETEPYSVKYHDLFVANIAATQELHKLVLEQQKEIADLKQQVSRIDSLENKINTLLQKS